MVVVVVVVVESAGRNAYETRPGGIFAWLVNLQTALIPAFDEAKLNVALTEKHTPATLLEGINQPFALGFSRKIKDQNLSSKLGRYFSGIKRFFDRSRFIWY